MSTFPSAPGVANVRSELLGLLLLAGPGGKPRDALIVECWPDAAPEAGVAQFHAHLHALRSGLEPEAAAGAPTMSCSRV